MDEIVMRALAKWPNVPDVFGWLALDQRGNWRLRGETLSHRAAIDFIGRNYHRDEHGRWFFQNGPQRVFVALDYTPWVYRLEVDARVVTHTGVAAGAPATALVDEGGRLLLLTPVGLGIVDDRDLLALGERFQDQDGKPLDEQDLENPFAGRIQDGLVNLRIGGALVAVQAVRSETLQARFGFRRDPAPICL